MSRSALVTGSGGLVGSEAVRELMERGYDVVGIENDMRGTFFGPTASTAGTTRELQERYPDFRLHTVDVRDAAAVANLVRGERGRLELVLHAAAQPSHDWAALHPAADFTINAAATLELLEAVRQWAPTASFVFLSTNKVYGDHPNRLPLEERAQRLDLPPTHPYHEGIDTSMSLDGCTHSPFGVSKAAADLMVQEYGRYYGLPTACFRCGCLSGPGHAGTRLHGFLSYLMRCAVTGERYTIYGYGGKQVRDNLHSRDVISAVLAFHGNPRAGAVYNLGGGRTSHCSLLEAIAIAEDITARPMRYAFDSRARRGDHRWWVSDVRAFKADYPDWGVSTDGRGIMQEIHDANAEDWLARAGKAERQDEAGTLLTMRRPPRDG